MKKMFHKKTCRIHGRYMNSNGCPLCRQTKSPDTCYITRCDETAVRYGMCARHLTVLKEYGQ